MAYPLAERKATGAHSEIDNLIGMNDLKQWWNSVKGKNILGQEVSPLTGDDMLDIAMSISPVGASIRGGKVAKSAMQQLSEIGKKFGIKEHPSKWEWSKKTINDFVTRNEISVAKIQNQKVLDKYGIKDPDKQNMVDPVSALLNYFSKN